MSSWVFVPGAPSPVAQAVSADAAGLPMAQWWRRSLPRGLRSCRGFAPAPSSPTRPTLGRPAWQPWPGHTRCYLPSMTLRQHLRRLLPWGLLGSGKGLCASAPESCSQQ